MALSWVIAGGGTGGHVTLALALGEVIASRGDALLFIGSDAGQEAERVPEAGFELVALRSRQVMGRNPVRQALGALSILRSSLRARRELKERAADLVVSVGGYAALPAALAASSTGTPLVLVEPNAIPGRSNRLTARFAALVFTGFAAAAEYFNGGAQGAGSNRVRCKGVPLRRALVSRFEAAPVRRKPEPPFRLLVIGGSQGAHQLNDAMAEAAPKLAPHPVQIFHQTGSDDRARLEAAYAAAGVDAEVVAFEEDMATRYGWADLAIARAGALTVAELALSGLPSLLVPYPWAADDHQSANARELEAHGAARRLEADAQHTLSGATVVEAVGELFAAPDRLADMSAAAAQLARPRAADEIIADCCRLLEERGNNGSFGPTPTGGGSGPEERQGDS